MTSLILTFSLFGEFSPSIVDCLYCDNVQLYIYNKTFLYPRYPLLSVKI